MVYMVSGVSEEPAGSIFS